MGRDGEGVATLSDGRVVFVRGALPGERARIRITALARTYGRAVAEVIRQAAPERVRPPCPVFGRCGGCALQHWDYAAELAYKAGRVRDALVRIGGFPDPPLAPVVGAPEPYGYRGKASFVWGGRPGALVLGLYAWRSHELVPVAACAIQSPPVNAVLAAATEPANRLGLEPYDERTGRGLLRHLVVRASRSEGRSVVLLVATRPDPRLRSWARAVMQADPNVQGVALNVNPERTNRILGDRTIPLAGRPVLEEEILGARFVLSPEAFFQVHPRQVEVLYRVALDALPASMETAVDLYAGVGTLAVLLGRRARRVVAVEAVPAAAAWARHNARANGVAVEVREGPAEVEFVRWVEGGGRADGVILDPPRSGARPPVLDALRRLRAPHVVYVSCNPETLARDLAVVADTYRLVRVTPVDLFPRTDHVECVAVLRLRDPAADEEPNSGGRQDGGGGQGEADAFFGGQEGRRHPEEDQRETGVCRPGVAGQAEAQGTPGL
ncbi:MAG: 23S rRNA (uracil(1939)-C(5))-methyltransferase RlmD [Actinomycetia bacterium]|nr:23S rRNA (uracil(1939)-C(5))-methyltransferase RlmD [Actinomycetes bacterium]